MYLSRSLAGFQFQNAKLNLTVSVVFLFYSARIKSTDTLLFLVVNNFMTNNLSRSIVSKCIVIISAVLVMVVTVDQILRN